jgi:hypothetical protein
VQEIGIVARCTSPRRRRAPGHPTGDAPPAPPPCVTCVPGHACARAISMHAQWTRHGARPTSPGIRLRRVAARRRDGGRRPVAAVARTRHVVRHADGAERPTDTWCGLGERYGWRKVGMYTRKRSEPAVALTGDVIVVAVVRASGSRTTRQSTLNRYALQK